MFELSEKEAEVLVWKEIMQETQENFTLEFQAQVLKAIKKIRALNYEDCPNYDSCSESAIEDQEPMYNEGRD